MRKLVVLLGVPVDNLSFAETLDQIERFVIEGRKTGKTHQVVTVNADFAVKAANDPELRYLLQEAHLATADGMPLVWAARILKTPVKERVTGADMVPALAERAAQKGYSLFFLGAAPGVAQRAADILKQKYPGLTICGVISPPYTSVLEMDPGILSEIRAARPDILMVAFGNPKQEKWIGMYAPQLKIPVMIGVGGSLDFVAGSSKRAPIWMQKSGLEWLYRLLREPRRLWRRYVVDLAVFSIFFFRQWITMRRSRDLPKSQLSVDLLTINERTILNLKGRLDAKNIQQFVDSGHQALRRPLDILVNMSGVDYLDSAGAGALVYLANQTREGGRELGLVAIPTEIYRTITNLSLDKLFRIFPDTASAMAPKPEVGPLVRVVPLSARLKPNGSENTWSVVKAPRRFDAYTAQEIKDICAARIEKNPFLILDFSETVLLASAGLAVLVQLNKLVQEKKGAFRLIHCSSDVQQTLRIVRLDKIIELYPDLSTAVA